jgi:hypothetical protein
VIVVAVVKTVGENVIVVERGDAPETAMSASRKLHEVAVIVAVWQSDAIPVVVSPAFVTTNAVCAGTAYAACAPPNNSADSNTSDFIPTERLVPTTVATFVDSDLRAEKNMRVFS